MLEGALAARLGPASSLHTKQLHDRIVVPVLLDVCFYEVRLLSDFALVEIFGIVDNGLRSIRRLNAYLFAL